MAPRLSVVVPIYNVQLYLDECLASLAAQTMSDLEVVMVDDGSTDNSAEIAREWEARDSRFRLVQKANGGLGPARNTGMEHIAPDSEFLCFVDSDDTLPPTAYELMLETLDRTGSDFVAGNVLRFRSVGHVQSPVHRKPFAKTRLATHISEFQPLTTDRTAWNKVYRRSFWDKHTMQYPGILYEDAPVSIPLHYLAEKVDVLAEPIYHWREREVGARSITQNRTDPKGLIDRVRSIGMVREFLKKQNGPRFKQFLADYDQNALVEEIPLFFRALTEGDDVYRTAFLDHVGKMIDQLGPDAMNALPQPMRLKYYLTVKRRMDDLLALLEFDREHPWTIPVRGNVRHQAHYSFLADVPDSVLRLDSELVVRTGLRRADWTEDGRLFIKGYAYPKHVGAMHAYDSVKMLMLRENGSRRTMALPAKTVKDLDVTAKAYDQPLRHCDHAGFELSFDPDRLKHKGQWVDGIWRVTVGVFGPGRPRRSRIKAGPYDSGANPAPRWVADNVRVLPEMRDDHLYLRIETVDALVGSASSVGDAFELSGRISAAKAGKVRALRLVHQEDGATAELECPIILGATARGWTSFTASVDHALMASARKELLRLRPSVAQQAQDRWGSELVLEDDSILQLVIDDREAKAAVQYPVASTADEGPQVLCFKRSPRGYLQIVEQPLQPVFEKVTALPAEQAFALEGTFPLEGRHALELVLRHNYHAQAQVYPAEAVDGRVYATLPALPNPGWNGDVPLLSGQWGLSVRVLPDNPADEHALGSVGVVEVKARLAASAFASLPVSVEARGRTVSLRRRWYDAALLDVEEAVPLAERGNYHIRRMRDEVYPAALNKPVLPQVLYDVFEGKDYSDSPKYIHQELLRRRDDLEHLWVVRDHRAATPPGTRAVILDSEEWYEAYARSRYIVGNTHFPRWITKRPGQTIVQTWHGTALKRIGFDFDNDWFADTDYLEALEREAKQWRLLLSPNRFSTPLQERAFRFTGETLESGYPRNDVLLAEDREVLARRVREHLGLPEGKKVVLYAPTWREDKMRHAGGHQLDLHLDLELMRRELGEDHVLLVRPHAHVVDAIQGTGDGFLWDVGSYPDIAELYLIADVLVTDYSSVMFDYAVTGRPILFFTYDLEHYRDTLRGFYFDFDEQAPGPLLGTSAEVVSALRNLDQVVADSAPAYEAFRKTYCDLDDGHAAKRVVDRMLEL
ncbi:CDP-glycerol glycerophosphotransferase family protein [Streptacidiphilus sp. MAP5-3]|uniref:bifunctional glycosyltransferase/CDP-glycerol:glycerophosphate glycerophosphotransferase n=1 Tax=unclassified Streptacidiphilus TaxID=2643834 RepID=UPI0035144D76